MYREFLVKKGLVGDCYLDQKLRLNRFIDQLAMPIEMAGYFNAESFVEDGVNFYWGWFYFDEVAELFKRVVEADDLVFSDDEILRSKKQIEAEKSSKYCDILIKIKNPSDTEAKLSLRLYVLLFDAIASILRRNFAHIQDDSPIVGSGQDLSFGIRVSIMNDFNFEKVKSEILEFIKKYPVTENWQFIEKFFEVFVENDEFSINLVEYFRNTGILTSREEIFTFLSIENVENILKKIEINHL